MLIAENHVFEGKVTKLEKPLLLLRKTRTEIKNDLLTMLIDEEIKNETEAAADADSDESAQISSVDNMSLDERTANEVNDSEPLTKSVTNYLVKAVIRRKIIFNKRPRAIVAQDLTATKKKPAFKFF